MRGLSRERAQGVCRLDSCVAAADNDVHYKGVRAEGEGGCQRNDKFLRTIVLIGCVKSVRGGRGSKIPKILRTYLMDAPLDLFLRSEPAKV